MKAKEKIVTGSLVLCIGTFGEPGSDLPFKKNEIEIPENGKNYTIREIVVTPYGTGVRLVEIKNPSFFFGNIKRHEEPIFGIEKFQLTKTKIKKS